MANINYQPNEAVILQEVSVAHGGAMAIYTDELILTNLNIYCINKGMFKNVKKVFCYPLNQIKMYNGKPQAMVGKLSNGTSTLEVFFMSGSETFNFQSNNKSTINKWIREINKILGTDDGVDNEDGGNNYTPVGYIKETWNTIASNLGFNSKKPVSNQSQTNAKVTKKCISCSAPLVGVIGQTVCCKYCDTDQTL